MTFAYKRQAPMLLKYRKEYLFSKESYDSKSNQHNASKFSLPIWTRCDEFVPLCGKENSVGSRPKAAIHTGSKGNPFVPLSATCQWPLVSTHYQTIELTLGKGVKTYALFALITTSSRNSWGQGKVPE